MNIRVSIIINECLLHWYIECWSKLCRKWQKINNMLYLKGRLYLIPYEMYKKKKKNCCLHVKDTPEVVLWKSVWWDMPEIFFFQNIHILNSELRLGIILKFMCDSISQNSIDFKSRLKAYNYGYFIIYHRKGKDMNCLKQFLKFQKENAK